MGKWPAARAGACGHGGRTTETGEAGSRRVQSRRRVRSGRENAQSLIKINVLGHPFSGSVRQPPRQARKATIINGYPGSMFVHCEFESVTTVPPTVDPRCPADH